MGGVLSLLGGIKGYLIAAAVAAVLAGTGGFTLAWKLQGGNIVALKLADATAQAKAVEVERIQAAAQRKLSDDAGAASAASQAAIRIASDTLRRKVPFYVNHQADSRCVVPVGALRLLDDALPGSIGAGAMVLPGQSNDAPSGVDLSRIIDLAADDRGAYSEVAKRLTDLQALIRAKQANSPAVAP